MRGLLVLVALLFGNASFGEPSPMLETQLDGCFLGQPGRFSEPP